MYLSVPKKLYLKIVPKIVPKVYLSVSKVYLKFTNAHNYSSMTVCQRSFLKKYACFFPQVYLGDSQLSLQGISSRILSSSFNEQTEILANLHKTLSKLARDIDEECVHTQMLYDTNVYPLTFKMLQRRCNSHVLAMYNKLYERVQNELPNQRSLTISWLQPPQVLLDMCAFLGDTAVDQYNQMLAMVPENADETTIQSTIAGNKKLKVFTKQALVRGMCCSLDYFCEFFWRFWTKSFQGNIPVIAYINWWLLNSQALFVICVSKLCQFLTLNLTMVVFLHWIVFRLRYVKISINYLRSKHNFSCVFLFVGKLIFIMYIKNKKNQQQQSNMCTLKLTLNVHWIAP